MATPLSIPLPTFCNVKNFEALLKDQLSNSKKHQHVIFDFSNLQWIGTLQTSLLYEWCSALRNEHIDVQTKLPKSQDGSKALYLLSNTLFFSDLEALGVKVTKPRRIFKNQTLAAFRVFHNQDELASYEKTLRDSVAANSILGKANVDLIRDGDFRDILLHELGQNAFSHGMGERVRYAITEFGPMPHRQDHSLLSHFSGKPFIEVVVSDSGPGLLKRLRPYLPEDYTPHATIANPRGLSKDAIVALYSLEFSSTSDPEGRKKIIQRILQQEEDLSEMVPTGLFYVASLARHYAGQILLRTGTLLLSIDFSMSPVPRVKGTSTHASISGTHVLVRVPMHREKEKLRIGQPVFRSAWTSKYTHFSLGEIKDRCESDADFLLQAERALENAIEKANRKRIPSIVALADGLQIDTKAFALLLISYATIQRRERALLLVGLRRELWEVALAQWHRIKEIRNKQRRKLERIHGYVSFIVACDDFSKTAIFGDEYYDSSTLLGTDGTPESHLIFTKREIFSLYAGSVKKTLNYLIRKKPIKHEKENTLYLIENNYYTPLFYEIRKLFSSKTGKYLAKSYVKQIIFEKKIDVIFVISEPLFAIMKEVSEEIEDIIWHFKDTNNLIGSYFKAIVNVRGSKNLLLIVDVLCTAREIEKFLEITPNLNRTYICCFVNAREDDYPYIVSKKEDKAYTVRIDSTLKDPIKPIFDLPDPSQFKILIIDPKTHSPTSYEIIDVPTFGPQKLVNLLHENKALYCGHLSFRGKHYSDFIYFVRLFNAMRDELYNWWDLTLANLRRTRVSPDDIVVFYLDEGRGWEHLVNDYMATQAIDKRIAISRDQLQAPPASSEKGRGKVYWFIMPAIASGTTIQRCLEYVARSNPDRMVMQIIMSRVDTTILQFYQHITGYHQCLRVKIDNLCHFPVMAYAAEANCPRCDALRIAERTHKLASGFNRLSRCTQLALDLFRIREITLEQLEMENHPAEASSNDIQKAMMKALFADGRKSLAPRKILKNEMLDPEKALLFFEIVGEEFTSKDFADDIRKRVIYPDALQALNGAASDFIQASPHKLSLSALFGINLMFPGLLQRNFKILFGKALHEDQKDLTEKLVCIALSFRDRYGLAVASLTDYDSQIRWQGEIIKEIRQFPYWMDEDAGACVDSLQRLLWLLRRSTPWGTNLESLRAATGSEPPAVEDIRKAFRVFLANGINKVKMHLEKLRTIEERKPGSLWSAIKAEAPELDKAVEKLNLSCKALEKYMDEGDLTVQYRKIRSLIKQVDDQGKELARLLMRVYANPIDLQLRITDLAPIRWPSAKFKIVFSIAPNQPGILIGLEDLIQSIMHYIDNADHLLSKTPRGSQVMEYEIRITFHGPTQDGHRSTMTISDNLPWKGEIEPSGGLKQFIKYCMKYTAPYEFNPDSSNKSIKIRVSYKIDEDGGLEDED